MRFGWRRCGIGLVTISGAYSVIAMLAIGTNPPDAPLTVLCGVVLAIAVVLVACRLPIGGWAQFMVWLSVLFLNLAAVAVEGTLFAPAAAPPSSLVINLARLLAAAVAVAALAALWFGRQDGIDRSVTAQHAPIGWVWRLAAAASVYFVLYFVIGGINYSLVTRPYYETHAGSLTLPSAQTVLLYEPFRGLLIALSVLPLTRALALRFRTSLVAVVAGVMLFVVGGLVPLLPQTSLPLYLRVASLWEIFGQNFLTGVACAYLFVSSRQVVGLRRITARSRIPGEAVRFKSRAADHPDLSDR